jgi:hypothetical protein
VFLYSVSSVLRYWLRAFIEKGANSTLLHFIIRLENTFDNAIQIIPSCWVYFRNNFSLGPHTDFPVHLAAFSLRIKHRKFVRFEVFTAVTMKNGVFLDVTPCGSCKN